MAKFVRKLGDESIEVRKVHAYIAPLALTQRTTMRKIPISEEKWLDESDIPSDWKPEDGLYKLLDPEKVKLPKTSFGWFVQGALAPAFGLNLLTRLPWLIWYVAIPILIQTAITSILVIAVYYLSGGINRLVSWCATLVVGAIGKAGLGDVDATNLSNFDYWTQIAVWVLVSATLLMLFFIFWRLTGGILTGYFGGRLTDKALEHYGLGDRNHCHTTVVGEMIDGSFQSAMLTVPQFLFGGFAMIPFLGPILGVFMALSYATLLTGYCELRDPLEKMGLSKFEAFKLCMKYRGAALGVGFSKTMTEPMPLIGGFVHAMESLGRITIARRILMAEGRLDQFKPNGNA